MVIPSSIYSVIATSLANAIEDGTSFMTLLASLGAEMQTLNGTSNIVGLVIIAENTLQVQQQQASPNILAAISAIQQNITTYYASVDGYLVANSLTVRQSFATASAAVGYHISSSNISG